MESWKADCKKKKKPYTCPNCRSKIENSVRSIHLDNLIAAIFRDANEEVKKDREELLKERKGIEIYFCQGQILNISNFILNANYIAC